MNDSFSPEAIAVLRRLPRMQCIERWNDFEEEAKKRNQLPQIVRALVKADLYYLLVRACNRRDMLNEFAFERCREVEAAPYGYCDLWAREHFKTSILTFGLNIQDILKDPEITIGIFSHTRPIAKAFLRQIMRELEENKTLKAAFPDVLWDDVRQAPKWSEDDGIIVRRRSNPNEATIEAWGLVDGQPVSKHFRKLHYDDIVVQASVSTPEMIDKTRTRLEESYNLGMTPNGLKSMAGTRWHFNDAYKTVVDRGTFIPREHPGRKGGTEEGESVYWSDEVHLNKRRDMGPYTYAAQILLNPKADAAMGFERGWLRHYERLQPRSMNGYILVDSANTKRKESDYTSIWAVLLGVDGNYYGYDMVRDRLNLTERTQRVITMHRALKDLGVKIQQVRWERYGMMADIEALKAEQEKQNYRFDVVEVAGQTSKDDRIRRLIPIFEQGKFYLPKTKHTTDWQKNTVDLVRSFVEEEYYPFPTCLHKDMLDALSRIAEPDLKLVWPQAQKPKPAPVHDHYPAPATAWMA